MKDTHHLDTRERFGEVVEASTTSFTTQCYRLYEAPPLGSLLRCGEDTHIYGIVHEVSTRSMDPARHPIARGEDEDTEDAVYRNNPQLSRLLLTEVRAIVVGYHSDGEVRRYLAPLPPTIYSLVYECSGEELRTFSSSLDFMPILLAAPIAAPEDVVTSFLRQASACHPDPERYLIDAGKELAALLVGNVQQLNHMLRRLSP
jgi:hypothetical protein